MAIKNVQKEKFCQCIASGMTQRQAYIQAYPNSKKWKPESVDCKASNLCADDMVKARIKELQLKAENEFIKSSIERKKWLCSIMDDEVERTENKLKACDMLNKMCGEYVQKIEADVNADVNINIELIDE